MELSGRLLTAGFELAESLHASYWSWGYAFTGVETKQKKYAEN